MAIQSGSTVGFYFLASDATTTLPTVGKTDTTIYFDAKNQEISVGDNLIASVNNNCVEKDNAEVEGYIKINNSYGTVNAYFVHNNDDSVDLITTDYNPGQTPTYLNLTIANPVFDQDAATKNYVDTAISTAITGGAAAPTWIVN